MSPRGSPSVVSTAPTVNASHGTLNQSQRTNANTEAGHYFVDPVLGTTRRTAQSFVSAYTPGNEPRDASRRTLDFSDIVLNYRVNEGQVAILSTRGDESPRNQPATSVP